MKKLLAFVLGTFLFVPQVFAGSLTTNGYFYLPALGASGATERSTWLNSLEATDGVIKDLVTLQTAIESPIGILVGDGSGGFTAITDNHSNWDTAYTASSKIGTLTASKWCIANGAGTQIVCDQDTPGAGSGVISGVGDCTGGDCLDGTSDGGTWIKFYDAQGAGQLITGDLTAARVWTMPNATGTVALTTSTVSSASTATALAANGVNCSAGQAPLGVDASGAVESCFAVLTQASIDTSSELRTILTDETGTGAAVFNTNPTFSGTVTATSFVGNGSGLTGLATSFTDSAGLAALLSDEVGYSTGAKAVFNISPSFTTKVTMPSSATPSLTSSNAGEIAFDTNLWATGHGAFTVADGSTLTGLIATLTSDSPTNGQVPKYNTDGTITWEDDNNDGSPTIAQYQIAYSDTTDNLAGDTGLTYNPITNVVTADGFNTTATSNPAITFKDSDASDGDVNGQIDLNCTTTTSSAENCGFSVKSQNAGTLTESVAIGNSQVTFPSTITIDAGAAGGFEIPNGAAPVVNAMGEIAWDSTDDQLIAYGSTIRVYPYTLEKCFTIENPVTADDNIPIWTPVDNITTTGIYSISVGNTTQFFLTDGTNDTETITADTDGQADDGSIVNGTFTAGETIKFSVAYGNTATTFINVCQRYTVDRQ